MEVAPSALLTVHPPGMLASADYQANKAISDASVHDMFAIKSPVASVFTQVKALTNLFIDFPPRLLKINIIF